MMDDEKLKNLIQYLNILSRLDGNYHNEIKVTIATIEKEFGITRNIDIKGTLNKGEHVITK